MLERASQGCIKHLADLVFDRNRNIFSLCVSSLFLSVLSYVYIISLFPIATFFLFVSYLLKNCTPSSITHFCVFEIFSKFQYMHSH